MKEIEIQVSAGSACGKSTVAEFIRQKLEQVGIKASLIDDNGIGIVEQEPGVIAQRLKPTLNRLRDDAEVRIRTIQTPRAKTIA